MKALHPKPDLSANGLSFAIGWALPTLIAVAASLMHDSMPIEATVALIAGPFAWIGVACLINANRCRRRHCYLSGPVLLVGAAAVVGTGLGLVPPGPEAFDTVIWVTVALVALTFLPEMIWGRYAPRREGP